MIRGNYDAANLMTKNLPLPNNPDGSEVMLSAQQVDCRIFESIGVAVHGKSFLNRVEMQNLAQLYPPPNGGLFNLGLLHKALVDSKGMIRTRHAHQQNWQTSITTIGHWVTFISVVVMK